MEPTPGRLRMFGAHSDAAPLQWEFVRDRLLAADTYWVTAADHGQPHPRPVWGVWSTDHLHLSVGSPVVRRLLGRRPEVTVHLDSGTDVVIVEGRVDGASVDPTVVGLYDAKYDWAYSVPDFGPLTSVAAHTVLAWRAVGPAGRDGFRTAGRWRF